MSPLDFALSIIIISAILLFFGSVIEILGIFMLFVLGCIFYVFGSIFWFFLSFFETKGFHIDHERDKREFNNFVNQDNKKTSFDYDKYIYMTPQEACNYIKECYEKDEIQKEIDYKTLNDRINSAKFKLEKKRLL